MVKFRIKISKRQYVQIALFLAVIGAAALFDIYSDNNNIKIGGVETGTSKQSGDSASVLFFSQTLDFGVKIPVLKSTPRKFEVRAHDKLIQRFYQLRNYQVLKAEVQTQTVPIISSYHYLAFKKYFFSDLGDDSHRA